MNIRSSHTSPIRSKAVVEDDLADMEQSNREARPRNPFTGEFTSSREETSRGVYADDYVDLLDSINPEAVLTVSDYNYEDEEEEYGYNWEKDWDVYNMSFPFEAEIFEDEIGRIEKIERPTRSKKSKQSTRQSLERRRQQKAKDLTLHCFRVNDPARAWLNGDELAA